jgi:hypothetical protein
MAAVFKFILHPKEAQGVRLIVQTGRIAETLYPQASKSQNCPS